MSIVNFAIPQVLEQRIQRTIKNKGFASRAELFRFAVLQYLDEEENFPFAHDAEMAAISESLGQALKRRFSGKTLPPLEEQMKRLAKIK